MNKEKIKKWIEKIKPLDAEYVINTEQFYIEYLDSIGKEDNPFSRKVFTYMVKEIKKGV